MGINRVGVIGTGLMGRGIAHAFAVNGFEVDLYGHSDGFRKKILEYIEYEEKKQRITKKQAQNILSNLNFLSIKNDHKELMTRELVIETIKEDKEIKKKLLKLIDENTKEEVIIASNTSTFSITELASVTTKPNRVIGMHFFSPVPQMKLVEIIKAYRTSKNVVEKIEKVVNEINKSPRVVNDSPGFVMSRLFVPFINEAVILLSQGFAENAETIDEIMKYGLNLKIGPLRLADLTGIDTIYYSMLSLYENLNDPKYRPATELKMMVDAGYLGRKSGKGFYEYR
ncbi:3-hydroxyacyl-CoA dehydrogenase family protein [Maledivibacter halophilus]|uniref:3-hydroxybutyryl-CoA dehydrogenase n=1 Tax=Maledivibacter halophilus TaxID=36842 RepID=A0A1T5LKF1_9FIRM|nr:3-hydroxyacyl-CoA dehydrogenase NAD-binding domain-containing protein [Maledivibacter halophilus]SKC76426.1 3-hydroxybutyryl-CoA dehydrogenase [Maledivibacter halophilus]